MLRNIIGPLLNLKNCVFLLLFLVCFSKILFFLQGERYFWKIKTKKKTKKMDHFLTLKRAKIGPLFNFTAYIYIYIYHSLSLTCIHDCTMVASFEATLTTSLKIVNRRYQTSPNKGEIMEMFRTSACWAETLANLFGRSCGHVVVVPFPQGPRLTKNTTHTQRTLPY